MKKILFLIFYHFRFLAAQTGCTWDINADIPANDPLYFRPNEIFPIVPSQKGLVLSLNENMILACSGKSNTVSGTSFQQQTVKCAGNNLITYNGAHVSLNSMDCTSPIQSELKFTKITCGPDLKGEIMNIGFVVGEGFVKMLEVCYDRTFDSVFYAKNTIFYSIEASEKDPNRPSFRTPGLTSSTEVSDQYKKTEQVKTFTTLLGSSQASKLLNSTSYLARGHLAPDADYMFGSWSTATYFLVNAAPQWQVVNAGNWLRVETLARETANRRNEDIHVNTGTYGVLELPNASGTLIKMYLLSGHRLRVPKWHWKTLYSPKTDEGIAFVTLNNPHATSVSPTELICKDICMDYLWYKPE